MRVWVWVCVSVGVCMCVLGKSGISIIDACYICCMEHLNNLFKSIFNILRDINNDEPEKKQEDEKVPEIKMLFKKLNQKLKINVDQPEFKK